MSKQKVIELTDFTIGYGKNIILTDLNLQIHEGEFVSILGENGAGKTTLFKGILQLLPVKQGRILVFDRDTTIKNKTWLRSQIGYVPQKQNSGNFPISVFDAVLLGRWGSSFSYFKRPSPEDKRMTQQILAYVDLEHMMSYDCRLLSGGQTQRLNIARALVRQPKILLLDEPNSHLDMESQKKLDALIESLRKEYNLTILMISHDQNHARYISDRVVHLKNGKIFEDLEAAL